VSCSVCRHRYVAAQPSRAVQRAESPRVSLESYADVNSRTSYTW